MDWGLWPCSSLPRLCSLQAQMKVVEPWPDSSAAKLPRGRAVPGGRGLSSLLGELRRELAQPRVCPKALEGCHRSSFLWWALLGAQQGAGWARAGWAKGARGAVGDEVLRAGSSAAVVDAGLSCRY